MEDQLKFGYKRSTRFILASYAIVMLLALGLYGQEIWVSAGWILRVALILVVPLLFWGLADVLFRSTLVSDEEIHYRSTLGRRALLKINEIEKVSRDSFGRVNVVFANGRRVSFFANEGDTQQLYERLERTLQAKRAKLPPA